MAKKAETVNMVDRFAEFKELKNIDKTTMISVLEESFRNVLAKQFGSDENFDVIMNPDKGDCEIYQNLEVVPDGEVENKDMQIGLTEAREIDPECEIGEEVAKQIFFEKFGRRAILNLRQTLQSKILDLQKDAIYSKFKEIEGEVVTAEVHQIWKREMLLIDEDQNELILPKEEQIPGDFFHKGDTVRAIVKRVDNPNNNPKVIISRTDPRFLRRLFELEGVIRCQEYITGRYLAGLARPHHGHLAGLGTKGFYFLRGEGCRDQRRPDGTGRHGVDPNPLLHQR